MDNPIETLRRLADSAAAAVDVDALAGMTAAQLIEVTAAIERLGRVVDARRVAAAGAIQRRSSRWLGVEGLAQSYGYRRGSELIEQATGVSAATARKRIRLAESLAQRDGPVGAPLEPLFPVVANAAAAGQIGMDAARAITTELKQVGMRADPQDVRVAERLLVAQAAGRAQDVADLGVDPLADRPLPERDLSSQDSCPGPMSADLVAVQARVWRDVLDPDGVEPRADFARARRFVSVSRTPVAGLHPLRGMLTPDVAAAALSYCDGLITQTGPTFTPADLDGPVEGRTYDQQCHDLFAVLLRAASATIGTDAGRDVPAPTPLVIRIDADQAARPGGTGSISGINGAVPASFLQQVACDGGVQFMVTRGGKIVKLGTKGRLFTRAQRRAVAVRDGDTCGVPGCRVPFAALEAHHVIPHSHDGPTHVDNCVLLCWWHHHMIDAGIWIVEMVNGKPKITLPIRGLIPTAA